MLKTAPQRTTSLSTRGLREFDRRGLIAFFVVAFTLSWSWAAPIVVAERVVRQGEGWPTHFPSLLGPLLAAFGVTAWRTGASGVRDLIGRMVAWRADWRSWVVATSPGLFLIVALIVATIVGSLPDVDDFGRFSGLPSIGVLGVVALIVAVNSFGEEAGWRGVALPHLQQRFHALPATLILAGLWALWHAPFFLILANYQDIGVGLIVVFVLGLTSGAVVLTWLYNHSGGSILLPVVWHGLYNVAAGTAAASGVVAATVTAMVMVHGGVLVWLEIRARLTHRPSVMGP